MLPNKFEFAECNNSQQPHSVSANKRKLVDSNNSSTKSKRGRKIDPKSKLGLMLQCYIQRLQDIADNKENPPRCDSDVELECEDRENSALHVKCAICKSKMRVEKFSAHKLKHNNIAWIEGEPAIVSHFICSGKY